MGRGQVRTIGLLVLVSVVAFGCLSSNDPGENVVQATTTPVATPTPVPAIAPVDGLTGTVAVVNVRLFDGVDVHERTTVLFADGVIRAVGPDLEVPADATVVAGEGMTLLPGLIDAHTHTFEQDALRRAPQFGVTTHLDMFTAPVFMRAVQVLEDTNPDRPEADLFSSGVLATVAGGHGTQFGVPIPTLSGPGDSEEWVDDRIAEGASFIKLVIEDFSLFGGLGPTLDAATLEATIVAAEANDMLTITHVSTLDGARLAIESGSDGLAHLFHDVVIDAPTLELMVTEGTFVVPTIGVLSTTESNQAGKSVIDDPQLGRRLTAAERTLLIRRISVNVPVDPGLETLELLHAAGVPILAGSDAPNPGTTYGASLHRELEFFVDAGMTPAEALTAATSLPASIFGLQDRGRVEPGMIADLLLVSGDPTSDILATRSIAGVWKSGVPVALDG